MSGEVRNISIQHSMSAIVEPGWTEMVRKFRPVVQATAMATEINVLFALALRLTRLAIASDLLARKGLDEEGHIPQRSAVEVYVNLCYIFYSGPRRQDSRGRPKEKTTRDLCLQFCAYADIAYYKLVKADTDRVRSIFKKRQGVTDLEFDAMLLEWARLDNVARTIHGCPDSRWHTMNIQDMSKKVLAAPPPFMDHQFCEMLLSNFVNPNSAVHADSLSLRSQYKDHGTDLLELVYKPDAVRGDAVASLAISSWKAAGWYLSEAAWVEQMIGNKLREVLRERWDQAPEQTTRTILLPDWLA